MTEFQGWVFMVVMCVGFLLLDMGLTQIARTLKCLTDCARKEANRI